MGDHTLNFPLRKASLGNPILAQLVEKGLFPKICLDIVEEFLFLVEGQIMGEEKSKEKLSYANEHRKSDLEL